MNRPHYHVLPSVEEIDIESKTAVTRRPNSGEKPMHFSVYLREANDQDVWVADVVTEKVAVLFARTMNATVEYLSDY